MRAFLLAAALAAAVTAQGIGPVGAHPGRTIEVRLSSTHCCAVLLRSPSTVVDEIKQPAGVPPHRGLKRALWPAQAVSKNELKGDLVERTAEFCERPCPLRHCGCVM